MLRPVDAYLILATTRGLRVLLGRRLALTPQPLLTHVRVRYQQNIDPEELWTLQAL